MSSSVFLSLTAAASSSSSSLRTIMVSHREFVGAGKQPGMQVWRIENLDLKPVPKNLHGNFFTGDAYLLLFTTSAPSYNIHMWLGKTRTRPAQLSANQELNSFYETPSPRSDSNIYYFFASVVLLCTNMDNVLHLKCCCLSCFTKDFAIWLSKQEPRSEIIYRTLGRRSLFAFGCVVSSPLVFYLRAVLMFCFM